MLKFFEDIQFQFSDTIDPVQTCAISGVRPVLLSSARG